MSAEQLEANLVVSEPERDLLGRGFSPAYGRLVTSEHDLVGMVAYSAYQAHKRTAVIEQRCHRDARWFDDWNRHVLAVPKELYREHAETRLRRFADTIAEGAYDRGRVDALREVAARSDLKRNYWVGVASSVTAALVVAVTTVMGVIFYTGTNPVHVGLAALVDADAAFQVVPAAGPEPHSHDPAIPPPGGDRRQ